MSLCIELPKGQVNKCMATVEAPQKPVEHHGGTSAGAMVVGTLFTLIAIFIWWHWQGKHERRILTGASRHFERERELENERVMKRIIERRITRVTNKEPGGIFIAQVITGNKKPKYFKFTQEMLAETVEDIYYYITESRTSIHEHKFTIETKRVFE